MRICYCSILNGVQKIASDCLAMKFQVKVEEIARELGLGLAIGVRRGVYPPSPTLAPFTSPLQGALLLHLTNF